MERRDFLKDSFLATGMLCLGGTFGCTPRRESENIQAEEGYVLEPSRRINILVKTDVLVVGGGPSGVAAAVSASRAGAETYLLERYNHLGGLWTGGLVLPLLSTHGSSRNGKPKQVVQGIGGEMASRLHAMGMALNEVNPTVDPEAAKYVMDEMVTEAGVKVIYHAWAADAIMDGDRIRGVFIESKSGRQAILAKVVIDCTGDGDVFSWCGEPFEEVKYHIGLVHRLGNTDRIDRRAPGFKEQKIGLETPVPGVRWCNMFGEGDQSGIDVLNLSRLQQKYRKDIWEKTDELRRQPGYEKVFLLDTASQLGVRVSRVLDGEYRLTFEDSMTYRSFDDVIGVSGAWTSRLYQGRRVAQKDRPYWQIPYRSLLPKNTDGLLVAGRCFCHDRELQGDARVIGTCLVTGHGAGAAAALAVKSGERPRDIDRTALRKLLLEQGAWLG